MLLPWPSYFFLFFFLLTLGLGLKGLTKVYSERKKILSNLKKYVTGNQLIYNRNIELYAWQQKVIELSETFNDRTINVIYDEKGNNGKMKVLLDKK